MTEAQAKLIDDLVAVLAADPRVRSAWLSGSLGRGAGDPWSDVDLVVEVDEADLAPCLADVMAGRQEWLLGQQGVGLLRQMLVDLMLEENGLGAPGARGGARRLNPFLDPDQRKLLEALVPPTAQREALLAAQAALAHLFLPRARALAERRGVPWPQALEDATRRHLRVTLDLAI